MVAAEMVLFGQAMRWMGFWGSWGNWPVSGIFLSPAFWIPVRCCHSWHLGCPSLNTTAHGRNDSSGVSKIQTRTQWLRQMTPGCSSHDTQTATDLPTPYGRELGAPDHPEAEL